MKTASSVASAGLHVTYVYVNYSVCNIAIIRRDNERQTILRGNGLTCGNESNSDNDFFNCSDDDKHRDFRIFSSEINFEINGNFGVLYS